MFSFLNSFHNIGEQINVEKEVALKRIAFSILGDSFSDNNTFYVPRSNFDSLIKNIIEKASIVTDEDKHSINERIGNILDEYLMEL